MANPTPEEKALIEEKEAQIRQLQDELRQLKDPTSIKKLMTTTMYDYNDYRNAIEPVRYGKSWDCLRRTCMQIFKHRHKGVNLTLGALSREEIETVAKMADEMVEIWNRYLIDEYGDDVSGESEDE